ncbi:MAG: Phenylalanyl-tRNA synthetase, beta subunit, cytoplasmic [Phylliscum demangeonii]|nr:MAG: Phenylalanyl-tRNA synthetase, beta subunit, cytoplasmic [Phylliscum demangeonii]
MATDLTNQVLEAVAEQDSVLSTDVFPNAPFAIVKAALDRLHSREMVVYQTIERDEAHLSEEGRGVADEGSHEAKVFKAVHQALEGLQISDLPALVGKESAKVGQGKAFKEGWIHKDNAGRLVAKVATIVDVTQEQLRIIRAEQTHPDPSVLSNLRKRKLVVMQKVISFRLSKGPKYSKRFVKEDTDLTEEMLADGSWKDRSFKPYNFKARGAPIFFEMGFVEMPTNRYVETGFWNFDALFVPQQHPARDLQDTFYISDPSTADKPRADTSPSQQSLPSLKAATEELLPTLDYDQYWNNVRQVHEQGKYGSIGYRYPWKEEESLRLVLRTHTTAISTYMLHKLAANPRPARYFSIDRVFRNETVDATHLAEFHQVEGVIADFGLTLGGLISFMETFFGKMGVHGLRFKPAYNPYTEPSMEIFGFHAGLDRWVEIGNSGMFRPEMLEPMGLPKDMRVYGWGLSLERPTMIKYGVKNIRELLGHKVDLNFIQSNPAVRLERD